MNHRLKINSETKKNFIKQKLAWAAIWIPLQICTQANMVFAGKDGTRTGSSSTGVPEIDTALTILKGILMGIVSAIGVIIIVKNLSDFSQAFQQHDSSGQYEAGKGIAAGLIMALIGPVLSLLGL